MKLYTWQDMCDYEYLLVKKWQIANESRAINEGILAGGEERIARKFNAAVLNAIKQLTADLGTDVDENKAKELGFDEVQ